MNPERIEKIIIAGGGIAGWMAAACISDALRGQVIEITVIGDQTEKEGRSEAGLPINRAFSQRLGIDEQTLMRETSASFSLGTRFADWLAPGKHYYQPLAPHGASIEYIHFHNYAIKARRAGDQTPINEYSLCAMSANSGKFTHPAMEPDSILSTLVYAHHFDSALYTAFMRRYAEANGVKGLDAKVVDAQLRTEDGFISSVTLDNGDALSADLFIDCSGKTAVLSEQSLHSGYEDWSQYLPANRMVSGSGPLTDMAPRSSITALDAGWYQSLPMQHCQAHRLIFCDRHLEDSTASEALRKESGSDLYDFEISELQQGHRKAFWTANCISLGSAAGCFEPLAGTRLALLQSGLMRLVSMFPDKACNPLLIDEYNQLTRLEYQNIRDFLVLHYRASTRKALPFWRDYLEQSVPESLAYKIRLFESQGQVAFYEEESFPDHVWASVWLGQDQWPAAYDPTLDHYDFERLTARFEQMKQIIQQSVSAMPGHQDYLARYCRAS